MINYGGLYPIYNLLWIIIIRSPNLIMKSHPLRSPAQAQKKQREVGRSNARDAKQEAAVPVWGGEGSGIRIRRSWKLGKDLENKMVIAPPTS